MAIRVCGNFAKDGQCGKCKHFGLVGICMGICFTDKNDEEMKETMTEDDCDCGKWEKGNPDLLN